MNVGDICTRTVVFAEEDTSLPEAARLMREHHVGDVVVVRHGPGGPSPVGIVTDRDVVVELLAEGLSAKCDQLVVSDLLTNDLLTARATEDPADVLKQMRARSVRRVPVVDDQGVLIGILTLDDVLDVLAAMLGDAAALAYRQAEREAERHPGR